MTPEQLATYLTVLRDGGCMSAELVLPNGATVRAVFAPQFETPGKAIDKDLEPGAWKWKGDEQ